MPDVARWVFRSPTHFAGTLAGIVAVLVLVGLALRGDGGAAGAAARPAPSPSRTQAAVARDLPAAAPFVDAAVTFARAWATLPEGATAAQWRETLRPLVTSDLATGLALTDPATLPGGTPTGTPTLRFLAASSALVEVPLSTGSSVLVTVVDDATGVRVSDVQPAEGDDGLEVAPEPQPTAGATP